MSVEKSYLAHLKPEILSFLGQYFQQKNRLSHTGSSLPFSFEIRDHIEWSGFGAASTLHWTYNQGQLLLTEVMIFL